MKLITLNYYGSYLDFNRTPHQATQKNVCRKLTNSKAYHPSFQSTRKQYWKVRCESLRQETTVVVDSLDVLHPGSCQQLDGVVRSLANYVPLSPISFLERAAQVYKHQTSVIYGAFKYTWEETYLRCIKLASAINHLGISRGDVVAALAPNVPAMLELHFAIPMAGGIICPLNTRLDANTVSTLLKHSKAKIIFVDYQLLPIAKEALNILIDSNSVSPLLVIISEPNYRSPLKVSPKYDYETLVEGGNVAFSIVRPYDECDPISLNYTSGTTSKPKGVVFSHRGAYMNSISSMFIHGMQEMPTYLWSLPMFHCNGWCFTWGVAIVGGTNVCLRYFNPQDLFDNIVIHKVTHMCGAPTVLNMIANSSVADQKQLPHAVEIMTGGAPPPPTIISKIEELGFRVSHIYGLTETYGPGTWSLWKPEWDGLPLEDRVKLKARQGVKHFAMEDVDVKDPITMESVKPDGQSIGEVMFRGNTVMSGYLNDLQATEEAFAGGWFHTGDLAVKHPDGFIEVKDRSKDIVISGGENICTIEVETVIYSHPAVLEVAVVARPDDHWGQTPCAFVKLKVGFNNIRAEEIIDHCRNRMPHFMVPKTVIFEDLPRNSTGKVQKFVLREKAEKLGSISSEKVE